MRCSVPNCHEEAATTLRAKPSGVLRDEPLDFPFCAPHAAEYEAKGYEGTVPPDQLELADG